MDKEITRANFIKSSNEKIAKFMGLKLPLNPNKYAVNIYTANGYYHKSWDWLMPVVAKITQMEQFKGKHIDACLYTDLASALIRLTDKELAYKAVVEFITSHNL